ncbi:hypothetical protein M011DRAFT_466882 [Sporormia fimetaria CBS 119925]|uniref:Uncharacterized protein n=1 Tax=Sporormia fimetaria CBS 119925 TaxID=1340428 RepID=A0A6A6VH96_9PLEO|nr:hypothetical protein M011DRAFT_466882 [Sporormia fimetaria CBS 119925]
MEDVDLGDQADSGQEYWHDGDYDGICDFELEDFPIDVENAEEEARRGSGVG